METYDAQWPMLEVAMRRPRSRDDLKEDKQPTEDGMNVGMLAEGWGKVQQPGPLTVRSQGRSPEHNEAV